MPTFEGYPCHLRSSLGEAITQRFTCRERQVSVVASMGDKDGVPRITPARRSASQSTKETRDAERSATPATLRGARRRVCYRGTSALRETTDDDRRSLRLVEDRVDEGGEALRRSGQIGRTLHGEIAWPLRERLLAEAVRR